VKSGTPILVRRAIGASFAFVALLLVSAHFGWIGNARAGSVSTGPTTGVVNITTALGYQGGAAAGTGIVLTSSGDVLTNNHVIRGATRVQVTVPSTGRTYSANVVGYSVTADVALIHVSNASGLTTAKIGNSSSVQVGRDVTAVGNAGGRGGTPAVTVGTVTGLHRSITVNDDQGGTARLTDLIQTNASLEPGDSGGPLLDSSGRVIGMDSAADTGFDFRGGGGSGFAIPINRALAIVKVVRFGRTVGAVHVGPTSFLGISVSSAVRAGGTPSGGALVSGVLPNGPADNAGLGSGDLITSIAGSSISSPNALVAALLKIAPGRSVQIHWTDSNGYSHSGTIRPIAGPPQ